MAKRAQKLAPKPEKPKPEQDADTGRFLPGNNGGPGRQRGSRNKLGEQFLQDLYADWQEGGVAAIKAVRASKPDAYLKVIASILPKELNVNVSEFEGMTDEQLNRRIRELAADVLGISAGASQAAERTETTH